jgi:hypothetical protein
MQANLLGAVWGATTASPNGGLFFYVVGYAWVVVLVASLLVSCFGWHLGGISVDGRGGLGA